MEHEILQIIAEYGAHTVVIALIINLLTNFLKKPIKAYARKSGKNINKYISFIPIILGFTGACLYLGFTKGWTELRLDEIFTLGLSSSSLSLALFAVIEKFLVRATGKVPIEDTESISEAGKAASIPETTEPIKIILGNKKDETETKES